MSERSDPARRPDAIRAVYPWSGHFLETPAGRLHYLDEGPEEPIGTIVAVHGNPTWSFYWRRLVAQFSDRYRVIVPDHIGCGLSDKPGWWSYRLADHRDNLRRLLDHLDVEHAHMAVHDWGGAIGFSVAVEEPERFGRFAVTNTAAFRSKLIPPSIAMCRIPGLGPLMVRGFNGFARVATFRAVEKRLAPEAHAGLLWPYDSWANRIATLRFVEDIPMKPGHRSWTTLGRTEEGLARLASHPMLIAWGDADFCFTSAFRHEWQLRFPKARTWAWADVGHYVMEDAPDRFLPLVEQLLAGDFDPGGDDEHS